MADLHTFLPEQPAPGNPASASITPLKPGLRPRAEFVPTPLAAPVREEQPPLPPQPLLESIPPAAPPLPDGKSTLPPEPTRTTRRVVKVKPSMPSLGILDPLFADDAIHDILVNGGGKVFIDRDGSIQDTGLRFGSEEEVWVLAELIMKISGQHWEESRPYIDTRLPDGSRVNIVAPPMAVDGITLSIRKFPALHVTLDNMVANGQLTTEIANFISECVKNRLNIIVAGGTGSGKTTLLNALSAAIPHNERIVTIEDSAELRLQQPHVVRLEAKAPTSVDAPHTAVTIRDLVKNALRMRPDRIIVGESRGEEAFDVLQAMNTGHDGSMTTLHANAPRDALSRLETMVSMAAPQLTPRIVRQQMANTVNLILQMSRTKDGRRITHISEIVGMEGDTVTMQDLVLYNEANGKRPAEHRWVAGGSRNNIVLEAARTAGLMRGLKL